MFTNFELSEHISIKSDFQFQFLQFVNAFRVQVWIIKYQTTLREAASFSSYSQSLRQKQAHWVLDFEFK